MKVDVTMEMANFPAWYCSVHRKLLSDKGDILVCPNGESFSRRNGIPRFAGKSKYADSFGPQWQRYRLTQLDSYTGVPITTDRARRCIGEDLWDKLCGKQVLECGCGAGRFTEILLDKGAYVTSVDLSEAVDANQKNFPQNEIHRIVQADILQLPFALQQFDMVFCLGVIQHTPNPEHTIARLYEQVKPGGRLVIDHYTHSFSWYTKTAPLFRFFFRCLPPGEGIKWTEQLVNILLPLHRVLRRFYLAQVLLSRLSPVLCYYRTYPALSDEMHREWALLDTHDLLTSWHRHVRTLKEIRRTLELLGLQEIWCEYGGNGVEARGKRPSL